MGALGPPGQKGPRVSISLTDTFATLVICYRYYWDAAFVAQPVHLVLWYLSS